MKYSILFIFYSITFGAKAQTFLKLERAKINEGQYYEVEKLKNAWYEKSATDTFLPIKNLGNQFQVLVDTNTKATNFISQHEAYLREESKKMDTSIFSLINLEGWNKLDNTEKTEVINKRKALSTHQADSIHTANNHERIQIWLINNTATNVSIPMQDGSYICMLQALNKEQQWVNIQHWRFSWCGNSYYDKVFLPNMANSFTATIPTNGNFDTKLRFKLLGDDEFHYSNEFAGKINLLENLAL